MRKTLAVAVLALWALIGLPGTAHAGGPTSVLITEPGTGQSSALYYTSAEYADLERMLAEGSTKTTEPPQDLEGLDYYNLTWMIHDVQPWRVDTVYVAEDGTAYVRTRLVDEPGETDVVQSKGRVVAQSEELVALLEQAFSGTASEAVAPPPVVDQAPAAAPAEPTTRWFSLGGWRWSVPGVLGGLLVGLVATRRRVLGEQRRTLVDLPPERAGV